MDEPSCSHFSTNKNCNFQKSSFELIQEEGNFQEISTCIPKLDVLFKNMFLPAVITEFCGLPGSGKTQICLHLCVGVKGQVVFVHTNNNLNPERLKEIINNYASQHQKLILENMLCIEASTPLELTASVRFLETKFKNEFLKIKLLIIDSIAWPLKQLDFSERRHFICTIFQDLRVLADLYKFSIVVTNDLTTRRNGNEMFQTSSFGDSFFHFINNRILLKKVNENFIAEVCKSVSGCLGTTSFRI